MTQYLRKPFGKPAAASQFTPTGWLKAQLQLQAQGQAGNLDKIWPDVRDSAWIGGPAEGWERVPYWLDGFIDLAWLLDDDDLKQRAKRYIDGILERQRPDGWLCPCPDDKRNAYDMWSLFLIGKVLVVWYNRTEDPRIQPALYAAFKNLVQHVAQFPLARWGKFRWYEGLIPIAWLYEKTGETWLLDLAETIKKQGFDYPALVENWPYPGQKEPKWSFEAHVVNLAMALHSELLYQRFHPESPNDGSELADQLLSLLLKYHGMATEHFTGDECLAGDSPSQGSELCSVVEAMFSNELLLAQTGNPKWADQLERLAFNALPATCSADMWTHQYDQQTNQIGCQTEPKPVWSTNGTEAHLFGLEPHYGCCTANHGQGWPKLAANTFLTNDDEIILALPLPGIFKTTVKNVQVTCTVNSEYPFRDSATLTVETEAPVEFTLKIRIPGFAKSADIDGTSAQPGTFASFNHVWEGSKPLTLKLDFEPEFAQRPRNMAALWYGPLLFALPIPSRCEKREYTEKNVQRIFPYCDYQFFATAPWNYAFAGKDVSVFLAPMPPMPFQEAQPPVTLAVPVRQIPWSIYPNTCAIANPEPDTRTSDAPIEYKRFIPYGSTILRMTEMPFA